MPVNNFSPTLGVLRGQSVEQGLSQAELEGIALRDQLAARRAAAAMGGGNYFTGYEGVPGATRPEYLKELFASGDPDTAIKMESLLAAPYSLEREVAKAGRIEEAKRSADARVTMNAMREFLESRKRSESPYIPDGIEPPSIPAVGEPTATPTAMAPQPNLSRLSGEETGVEFSLQGPKFTVKDMSDFDRAIKIGEDQIRRVTAGIAGAKERRETVQATHENVRKVSDEIATTQKMMQNRDITWDEGQQRIEKLNQDLNMFSQQRDQLLSGRAAPSSTPAPISMTPTAVPAPTPGPGRFTQKEQGALDVKNREEQITLANKEVTNAKLGAQKVLKFKRQMAELFDLVTKQDIGHPTMEGIPGATNILGMSRANAQVKKLGDGLINMFAEPGQSQMMNTIVERQMQGALVPGLFTDPQLNKINAAILRSNMEHLSNFPSFLEKWQRGHNGTVEGADEAWIDYTENNPRYIYSKDKRGKVTVADNKNVVTPEAWTYLRSTGGVRKIGDRMFVKQKDGSWVEK